MRNLFLLIFIRPLITLPFSVLKMGFELESLLLNLLDLTVFIYAFFLIRKDFNIGRSFLLVLAVLYVLFVHSTIDPLRSFANAWVLIRYIPFFIVLLNRGRYYPKLIQSFLRFSYIFQLIVGVLQIMFPFIFVRFLLPVNGPGHYRIARSYLSWDGTIFGTFTDTISFSYFLIVAFIFQERKRPRSVMETVIVVFLLYHAKAMAPLGLFLLYLFYTRINIIGRLLKHSLLLALLSIFINATWNNVSLIGPYMDQRLGILLYLVPGFFAQDIFQVLVGIGHADSQLKEWMFALEYIPGIFLYDRNGFNALNDVWIVAFMIYYGMIGLTLLTSFLHYLWKLAGNHLFKLFILGIFFTSLFVNQTMSLAFVMPIIYVILSYEENSVNLS